MGLTLITPPTLQPVTLAEAKNHLRVDADITQDEQLITDLIDIATATCEKELRGSILPQTWQLSLDMFPYNGVIDLTKGPVSAVTALRYYDTAGVVQTIAPVNYVLDTNRRIARLVAAVGYSWPAVWFGYPGVVQVMYTAGYADATKVPKPIKQWILMCLAALYESREQVFIAKQRGQTVQVMPTANSLLERYLVEEIG